MNRREKAKARTKAKIIETAKALWATPGSYETGTIRHLAKAMGMSTGAIFANFPSKDDVWRAVFPGREPPIDSALTRAASDMRTMLEAVTPVLLEHGYPQSAGAIDALLAKIDASVGEFEAPQTDLDAPDQPALATAA